MIVSKGDGAENGPGGPRAGRWLGEVVWSGAHFLLHTCLNHIPRNKNRVFLVHAYSSGDCLVLYAWVPLRFDDKSPICTREIQATFSLVSASDNCS
jgi:hypothetical protein